MLDYHQPDARGRFGPVNGTYFGGTFVAETLIHALRELESTYDRYRGDAEFQAVPHLEQFAGEAFDGIPAGGLDVALGPLADVVRLGDGAQVAVPVLVGLGTGLEISRFS